MSIECQYKLLYLHKRTEQQMKKMHCLLETNNKKKASLYKGYNNSAV